MCENTNGLIIHIGLSAISHKNFVHHHLALSQAEKFLDDLIPRWPQFSDASTDGGG